MTHFLARAVLLAFVALTAACTSKSDVQWPRTWGNRGYDLAFGLAMDADGGLYTGSQFSGEIEPQPGRRFTAQGNPNVLLSAFTAQGAPRWQLQLSSPRAVEVRDIVVAHDGAVFATGYYVDSLSAKGTKAPLKAVTGADAWVGAWKPDGDPVFLQGFGSKGADAGFGLCALPDGGVMLAGTMQQAARFGTEPDGHARVLRAAGARDVFLTALDSAGGVRWARLLGGSGDDRVITLATMPDGGCAALLTFQGTLTLEIGGVEQRIDSRGGEDGLVLGVSADGSVRFATPLAGTGPDFWEALTVAGDGTIWAAGLVVMPGNYVLGDTLQALDSVGSSDVLLVALDRKGRFLLTRRFGNAAADTVHDLAPLPHGVVMAASGSGELQLDGHRLNATLPQAYVVALDADGQVTTARMIQGEGITQATALAVHAPGQVAVLGMFEKALLLDGAKPLKAQGKTDVFLAMTPLQQ